MIRIPGHVRRLGNISDIDIPRGVNFERYQLATAVTLATEAVRQFTSPFGTTTRAIVMINDASMTGAGRVQIRLGGATGVENTGYLSHTFIDGAILLASEGLQMIHTQAGAESVTGMMTLVRIAGTTYVSNSMAGGTTNQNVASHFGRKVLTSALETIQVASNATATDNFDGSGNAAVAWYGF